MITCLKFGLPMTKLSVFFDVLHVRYHHRKIVDLPHLTNVLRVEGNAETKHCHTGPSPGIAVDVPSVTQMDAGSLERTEWKTESIHWVRHPSVPVRKSVNGVPDCRE